MRKEQTKKRAKMAPTAEPSEPQWLTPAELAARFRVSESTVRRNIHTDQSTPVPRGKIRGIRIGRQLRVHINTIEKLQAEPMAKPTTDRRAFFLPQCRKDRFADL